MNHPTFRIVATDTLNAYDGNPRKNDPVVYKMCQAIREFGFRIPIVAKSDGTVVDGHLRLKAAKKLGLKEVPIALADELSDAQIKAFRLLANQSSHWAEWDEALLQSELAALKDMSFDLELTGFDLSEVEQFLSGLPEPNLDDKDREPRDTDDDDDEAEDDKLFDLGSEAPPITKPGDLWILGEHRLLCEDSRRMDAVERLLEGKLADMAACDPPYNVNYGGELQGYTNRKNNAKRILNDKLGTEFQQFLYDVCVNILTMTKGAVYICMAASELHTLHQAFKQAGGYCSGYLIWAKNHFTLGTSDYQRQYEPILYGWKQGNTRYWCGDRGQSDIWFMDKPYANRLHPTMKPISLMKRMIKNSSKPGGIVLDLFGGSGTTLIAADKTKRKCRMMELDPQFCDTIIRRWQRHTGGAAVLASTGHYFNDC